MSIRKIKMNIDRLEITYTWNRLMAEKFSIPSEKITQGRFILTIQTATTYRYNYKVSHDGTPVGTFFFGTFNPNRPYYYLSVENRLLYESISTLYDFEREMQLQFLRISKLDICMDSDVNLVSRFYRLLKDKEVSLIVNNKAVKDRTQVINSMIHYSKGSLNNVRKVRSFTLAGNDYEMKGYNKGDEIASTSHKEYIRDSTGLGKRIYRMEVSFPNYKTLSKHLELLGLTTKDIYDDFSNKEVLQDVFVRAIHRIIHLKGGRSILGFLTQDPNLEKCPKINISQPYLLMGRENDKSNVEFDICGTDFAFRPDSNNENKKIYINMEDMFNSSKHLTEAKVNSLVRCV